MKKRAADAEEADSRQFRSTFLEVLEPAVAEGRKRLAAIAGADDVKNVHRSRVQVKRIRYMVEPLRTQTPEARAFAKQLKDLQRLLGELHDVHLLESQLASAVEDAATEKARRVHRFAVEGDDKMLARVRRRDESLGLVALAAMCPRIPRRSLSGAAPRLARKAGIGASGGIRGASRFHRARGDGIRINIKIDEREARHGTQVRGVRKDLDGPSRSSSTPSRIPKELSSYFTTGGASGPLREGATVEWKFGDFPGEFPVKVTKVVPNERIELQLGGGRGRLRHAGRHDFRGGRCRHDPRQDRRVRLARDAERAGKLVRELHGVDADDLLPEGLGGAQASTCGRDSSSRFSRFRNFRSACRLGRRPTDYWLS